MTFVYQKVFGPCDLFILQITRGLNFGEYRCRTEKDIAMICALEYYVEQGANMDSNVGILSL